MINQDYDQVISRFDKSGVPDSALEDQIENLKNAIIRMMGNIVETFGEDLKLKFANTESIIDIDGDTTLRYSISRVQFENDEFYGLITLKYNDNSKLLSTINLEDFKKFIPDQSEFWMLGIYPLIVLLVNIFVIIKVIKTKVRRKWLLIIVTMFLNIPSVNIHWNNEIYVDTVMQFLLGVGFETNGYQNMTWSFGIPLGALLVYGYINKKRKTSPNNGEHP